MPIDRPSADEAATCCPRHANEGGGQRMDAIYFVSGLIVAALVVYLLYVLARPEQF